MRNFLAFFKKEWLEARRGGRLLILGIVFTLLGIMNPAIAKLTPWMLELMADQLAESGMTVSEVTVDAVASWVQFIKNIPVALIVYILMCGGCFTKEYESGTLVLLLTKGLRRSQALSAKTAALVLGWSVGYIWCFGITYGYNAYFWDNSVMPHLWEIAIGWWLFGVWTVLLSVFFSSMAKNTSGVLLGTAGGALLSYLLGLIPKVKPYTPTALTAVTGTAAGADGDMTKAVIVTAIMSAALVAGAVLMIRKKAI